jgi:hypothetical protein
METMTTTGGSAPAGGRRPTHAAYNIIERKGSDKSIWSRVGSAWLNRDGSFNVVLDSYPVGGKIHVREDKRDEKVDGPRRGPLGRAADDEAEEVSE